MRAADRVCAPPAAPRGSDAACLSSLVSDRPAMDRISRLRSNSVGLYPRTSSPAVCAAAQASRRNRSLPRTTTWPQPRAWAMATRLCTTTVFSLGVVSRSPRSVNARAPSAKKYAFLICTNRFRTSSGTAAGSGSLFRAFLSVGGGTGSVVTGGLGRFAGRRAGRNEFSPVLVRPSRSRPCGDSSLPDSLIEISPPR